MPAADVFALPWPRQVRVNYATTRSITHSSIHSLLDAKNTAQNSRSSNNCHALTHQACYKTDSHLPERKNRESPEPHTRLSLSHALRDAHSHITCTRNPQSNTQTHKQRVEIKSSSLLTARPAPTRTCAARRPSCLAGGGHYAPNRATAEA